MESDESLWIAASIAQRAGKNPDAARVADAIIAVLREIEVALTPIIGLRGVTALYRRCLLLCSARHPCLADTDENAQTALDLAPLRAVLERQSPDDAWCIGLDLLVASHQLLTSLIGPSLCERLLRSVWENPLSGTPPRDTST
jgi:hypothetical protein